MKLVNIRLKGIPERLPDAPSMPEFSFDLEVYENEDQVSKSIREQGIWEAFETRLVLDILKGGNVVDLGCHIGWYSIIAALKGCTVVAYDELLTNLEVLRENAKLNKVKVTGIKRFIDETAPILPSMDIELLKCDIEGNEQWALRMYEESFKEKRVKYAIMEISPCFNDSYPSLVEKIDSYGYKAYQIPGKLYIHHRIDYGRNPLKTMLESPVPIDWKTLRQENFLFIREDLI